MVCDDIFKEKLVEVGGMLLQLLRRRRNGWLKFSSKFTTVFGILSASKNLRPIFENFSHYLSSEVV